MTKSGQVTLAIESAINGGSISLISGGVEIASWIGTSGMSKAEELLVNIDRMLTENDIPRRDLGLIAVSAGPGSFTGIRIGISTALGLKTGLGIPISSESALKAMVHGRIGSGHLMAALPVGRNAVCLQTFSQENGEVVEIDKPYTVTENDFIKLASGDAENQIVAHASLCEKTGQSANIHDFGQNLAFAIGIVCSANPEVVVEPLFISKNF